MKTLLSGSLALFVAACSSAGASDDGTSASALSEAAAASETVTFAAKGSGLCLDVPGDSTKTALQLQQATCNGTDAQKFGLVKNADGTVTLINVHSNLCVDLRSDSAANGDAIQMYTCNGSAAQKVTLGAVSGTASGVALKTSRGSCFDIRGKSTASGALLDQSTCTGATNQTFTMTVDSTPTPPTAPPTTPPAKGNEKSLKEWAKCDGTTDDSEAVAKAFAAAASGAFTLLVDCPAKLHIGSDTARPIFVDDGTTVIFSGAGKFFVDNLFIPAFVLADSNHVVFTGWNVEWDGSLPVATPDGNASGPFNDDVLTPWLTAHRKITFDGVKSWWMGQANTGAVFFLIGDTANVTITGLDLYAPKSAGVDHFIPFGFSFGEDYKANQTVSASTPRTSAYRDAPHDLTFSDITFDGTYMGFQGTLHDAVFSHVHSERYGDLTDAKGDNVGGVGKWFPPPHLFYLTYDTTGDASLFNRNVQLSDVTDDGIRLGTARDKGGSDTVSGYALSLKIGGDNMSVNGYTTARPDGFLDVLASDGLTIENVVASYDSQFINDAFNGWRFPGQPYRNVTFSHIKFTDTAATVTKAPIGNSGIAANANILFTDVTVNLKNWKGTGSYKPTIFGEDADSAIDFVIE